MAEQENFEDQPISEPAQDQYGITPLAEAIAASIRSMKPVSGSVLAINGPWGAGKSSVVNLVRHYLIDDIDKNAVSLILFNCWWFRGEEALALAFFRELYAGMGPTLGEELKDTLPKLGARLLKAGKFVSPLVDLAAAPGAGGVVSGAMDWISNYIRDDDTVEGLHQNLSRTLRQQDKKFVVVIDDIDRLTPDEALLIFRLVKSAGRLPNVIYLLVFDRVLAEKAVAERYPSEGPHFLEKIVQASFDIPPPTELDLRAKLLGNVECLCGSPSDEDVVEFLNIFYDAVAPLIKTPRDVVKLSNALSITWPSVKEGVHLADFVAMETLRLLKPALYKNIRDSKAIIFQDASSSRWANGELEKQCNDSLLASIPENEWSQTKTSLMRLFPQLQRVWSNVFSDDGESYARNRRVCASRHFDTYFRFSLGEDVIPKQEIYDLIENAWDHDFVSNAFRAALGKPRKSGGSYVPVLFEELLIHANSISDEAIEPFLGCIFGLADELDLEADRESGFARIGSNPLRIHWLLRRLTLERFSLEERSQLLKNVCQHASLVWLFDFASSALDQHESRENKKLKPEGDRLLTKEDADEVKTLAVQIIRQAAADSSLAHQKDLLRLLYRWRAFVDGDSKEILTWTASLMESDEGALQLASALVSETWSIGLGFDGMGDRVSRRHVKVSLSGLRDLLDSGRFRARLTEIASDSSPHASEAQEFLELWDQALENPDPD